jgi:hypothetical protein
MIHRSVLPFRDKQWPPATMHHSLLRASIALIVLTKLTSAASALVDPAAPAVTWKEDSKTLTLDNGLFRVSIAKPQVS